MKRPSMQFYPGDWRKDVELRSCTIAARGLWIDLMCLAHECHPYGHLTVNGKPMTVAQMAGQIGLTAAECKKLLQELIDNGVARVADSGAIFSQRMVRDEQVRNARAEGGKSGAGHGAKGAAHGAKGGRPRKETDVGEPPSWVDEEPPSKPPLDPPSKPPPSSSSSSSSSSSVPGSRGARVETGGDTAREARPTRAKRARATPLPEGFALSDAVRVWAEKRGFGALDEHLDAFCRKAQAKGYTYVDWDAAFMEAVREDWAGIRSTPRSGGSPGHAPRPLNRQAAIEAENRRVADEWLAREAAKDAAAGAATAQENRNAVE